MVGVPLSPHVRPIQSRRWSHQSITILKVGAPYFYIRNPSHPLGGTKATHCLSLPRHALLVHLNICIVQHLCKHTRTYRLEYSLQNVTSCRTCISQLNLPWSPHELKHAPATGLRADDNRNHTQCLDYILPKFRCYLKHHKWYPLSFFIDVSLWMLSS